AKRAVLLAVSVPVHTSLMRGAAERLAERLKNVEISPPKIQYISAVDATVHQESRDLHDLLVRQLPSPVRWVDTVRAMAATGITRLIECGPGKDLRMLKNDVALVTGASRGIGHEIALALAGAGARVIGTSTSAEGAAKLTAELASHGYNGRGAVLDVGNPASIDALMTDLDTAGEMPTILVNNAAITRDTVLLRMKPEDWDLVLTTNLTSVFRLSKACLRRMMKERHGRIIN